MQADKRRKTRGGRQEEEDKRRKTGGGRQEEEDRMFWGQDDERSWQKI
jgi:hypothetical protein